MESSAITRNMQQLLEQYKQLRGTRCREADSMWSLVVITTADCAQQEAFLQQIHDKQDRSELPLDLPIHVVSDPPGPRIGNGGSTLTALEFLHSVYGEAMYQHKILLIHAGGWSQRMPSATILGKVFAAIPHGEPLYQMLDLKLAMYCPLIPRLSPGILLVCADDFLVYDLGQDEEWSIPTTGFTALAHPSPLDVGRTHGVYVVQDADQVDTNKSVVVARCREVLQKPSDDRMKSRGALLKSHNGQFEFADGIRLEGDVVYTDSCFYFGVDVMKRLLKLKRDLGTISCEIDAYGDFLQALGPDATDDYIYNTSNISQVTSQLTKVRKRVFGAMRECDIHLLLLNASKFIHVGTTKELIHHFCQDSTFQSQMALQKDVFNCWLPAGLDVDVGDGASVDVSGSNNSSRQGAEGCVMHSVLMETSCVAATSVVEYCHFEVPVVVEQNAIVSNCQWLRRSGDVPSQLVLPSDTFLHTVSLQHGASTYYVTIFFSIADNLKTSVAATHLTSLPFLNATVGSALRHWRLSESVILSPQTQRSEVKVNLWTLKLYPGSATMTQSLELALDMLSSMHHEHALSRTFREDQQFFSLSDALAHKDISTMLSFRRKLFDQIQSGGCGV